MPPIGGCTCAQGGWALLSEATPIPIINDRCQASVGDLKGARDAWQVEGSAGRFHSLDPCTWASEVRWGPLARAPSAGAPGQQPPVSPSVSRLAVAGGAGIRSVISDTGVCVTGTCRQLHECT